MSGRCAPTAILDWDSTEVSAFAELLPADARPADGQVDYLRAAHALIARTIRPVYAVDDRQAASETIRRLRGSCSQRLAVLESLARRAGIATRVRGLVVDGSFWYPRFPRATWLVPSRVVLAWPEFLVDGAWLPVTELYGDLRELAACGVGFSNAAGETLFEAVGRTAVDWDGATSSASCDLSAMVRQDLGYFDDRDGLFDQAGQTLCRLARTLADPVLSRRRP